MAIGIKMVRVILTLNIQEIDKTKILNKAPVYMRLRLQIWSKIESEKFDDTIIQKRVIVQNLELNLKRNDTAPLLKILGNITWGKIDLAVVQPRIRIGD